MLNVSNNYTKGNLQRSRPVETIAVIPVLPAWSNRKASDACSAIASPE